MDLSSLHLESGTFIDAELREHYSDILYQVNRTDGKIGYVYMLFEHKSYLDPDVAFQILRYKVRIWEQVKKARQQARKRDKQQVAKKLPPIFPLLVYHGEQQWGISTRFSELIELSEPWRAYCPEFEYYLHDLSGFEPDEIRDSILLRAALLVMKHIFEPALAHRLSEVLTFFVGLTQQTTVMDLLQATLRYIAGANPYVTGATITDAIVNVFEDTGDDMVGLAARQWKEEGKEEGIELGLRQAFHEAIQEGLEIKFGVTDTKLNEDLATVYDVSTLRALNAALYKITTLEEYERFFQALSRSAQRKSNGLNDPNSATNGTTNGMSNGNNGQSAH